jgi:hypothetical protein
VFNLLSWPADLGTGLGKDAELPCLSLQGLTTVREGKLTCRLTPSTKSSENPYILVTGFDAVPAASVVSLAIDGLISLNVSKYETITVAVRIGYRSKNNLYGYLYEPTGLVVGPATGLSVKAATASIIEAGLKKVGSLASYTVTLTLPGTASTVTTSDYIRVVFPALFFDRYNTKAENVTCTGAGACLLFLKSNHLYVRPSASLAAGASFTFTIGNLGWTSYKMVRSMSVRVESIVGNKIDSRADAAISKEAAACTTMVGALISPSSNGGGDSSLNYTFSFKASVPPPPFGTLTLEFPSEYRSLLSLGASCELLGDLASTNSSCWVSGTRSITVGLNGTTLDGTAQYNFVVRGITNPNGLSSSSVFQLKSHYDENTYLNQTICETTFASPALSVVELGSCDVSAEASVTTSAAVNNLTLSVLCPRLIGNGTFMKVFLPGLTTNSTLPCSSSRLILMQDYCPVRSYSAGSYLEVQLRQVGSFSAFTVYIDMTNPAPGKQAISLEFERGLFTYMRGNASFTVTPAMRTTSTSTLSLKNYPTNAGQPSLFMFTLSNYHRIGSVRPTSALITFPTGVGLSEVTGCRYSNKALDLSLY